MCGCVVCCYATLWDLRQKSEFWINPKCQSRICVMLEAMLCFRLLTSTITISISLAAERVTLHPRFSSNSVDVSDESKTKTLLCGRS